MLSDTIVAISTAVSGDAISIVRLSGENAIDIVSKLYQGKDLRKVKSHTINYGKIYDETGSIIDEVLVSVMKAPKTYTGENIVEVNCHGGSLVTEKILQSFLNIGARLAEPGEFTKRSFLNGKLDLTQAESVMDIIEARTDDALKIALGGLKGTVGQSVRDLRDKLLNAIAQIEVSIDYPEYDETDEDLSTLINISASEVIKKLTEMINDANTGQLIKNGIKTAIIGRPNVGKSSLLNAMLKEEKAIVTNIAGTTRDVVEGHINIGGIHLNLFDTAGIRKTGDVVEQIGIEKSKKVIEEADLILLLLNNNEKLSIEDKELLEITKEKNRIIIINKADLPSVMEYDNKNTLKISLKSEHVELNELNLEIKKMFNLQKLNVNSHTYVTNARQVSLLKKAKNSLVEVQNGIDLGMAIPLICIDLTNAFAYLGDIIGENKEDELINSLFSKFCLGK